MCSVLIDPLTFTVFNFRIANFMYFKLNLNKEEINKNK